MENLGQVAGKIDTLGGQFLGFKRYMETALSSINDAVANINTELTTIENRLDALDGGDTEPGNGDGDGGDTEPSIEP